MLGFGKGEGTKEDLNLRRAGWACSRSRIPPTAAASCVWPVVPPSYIATRAFAFPHPSQVVPFLPTRSTHPVYVMYICVCIICGMHVYVYMTENTQCFVSFSHPITLSCSFHCNFRPLPFFSESLFHLNIMITTLHMHVCVCIYIYSACEGKRDS